MFIYVFFDEESENEGITDENGSAGEKVEKPRFFTIF